MKSPFSFGFVPLIVVVVLAMLLLFPSVHIGPDSAPKAQAKNDVTQLAAAITAFEVEYGRLPRPSRGIVDRELMDILTGKNDKLNPRKIVFFEPAIAKKGRGGLTGNGTCVDPWGAPYQIAFRSGTNDVLRAGVDNVEIRKRVAVWNTNSMARLRVNSWE